MEETTEITRTDDGSSFVPSPPSDLTPSKALSPRAEALHKSSITPTVQGNRDHAIKLGVVRLDYVYTPAPGDIDHPESYAYEVVYRVVPGLTFETCQLAGESGGLGLKPDLSEKIREEFVEVIRELEQLGVCGITYVALEYIVLAISFLIPFLFLVSNSGDCGFMMWFQDLARQNTKIPVFMSALAHLPTVTAAFGDDESIMIMTANGKTLNPMINLIKEECSIEISNERFKIVGCETVSGFEAVANGEKVNVKEVTPGIVKLAGEKIEESLKTDKPIRAILLECTELPPYADALRAATGLPVFDAITNADFFMSGFKDNPNFGIEWQSESRDNISAERIRDIVSEYGSGLDEQDMNDMNENDEGHTNVDKARKLAETEDADLASEQVANLESEKQKIIAETGLKPRAKLGVLQLEDFSFPMMIGHIDNPQSHSKSYDVIYYKVPGLTLQTCLDGPELLPQKVKVALKRGIEFLDQECDVQAIASNCGIMIDFNSFAKNITNKPVCLSPLFQIGSIDCSAPSEKKIVLVTQNKEKMDHLVPIIESLARAEFSERFLTVHIPPINNVAPHLSGEDVQASLMKKVETDIAEGISKHNIDSVSSVVFIDAELPQFSDYFRKGLSLPIFDMSTACESLMCGVIDNDRFGVNAWRNTKSEGPKFYTAADLRPQTEQEVDSAAHLENKESATNINECDGDAIISFPVEEVRGAEKTLVAGSSP